MNVKSISRTVGLILLITGIFQLFPLLIAVIDHEPRNILAYIESLCLILLVGSALLLFSSPSTQHVLLPFIPVARVTPTNCPLPSIPSTIV